jgi:hypothetical protein
VTSTPELSPGTSPACVDDREIEPLYDSAHIAVAGTESSSRGTRNSPNKREPPTASTSLLANLENRAADAARETTSLLRKPIEFVTDHIHPGPCNHGTFSPQPYSRPTSPVSGEGFKHGRNGSGSRGIFGSIADGIRRSGSSAGKKMSTTARLAEEHGINHSSTMYVPRPFFGVLSLESYLIIIYRLNCKIIVAHDIPSDVHMNRYFTYYIPFFAWIRQYKWAYLHGDLIAAITMASFYIPMALSYASNLGHVPPINGLYSFVFNPLIYALLGSCPQMVVGPEAAGSLLLGSVVRESVDSGNTDDEDAEMHARVAGLVTGIAGAVIFIAGLTRLGFLDSVLSRPFMRGFISSVGVIIIVDQLLTQMGLVKIAQEVGVAHGSSIDKLGFIFTHLRDTHGLTFIVAGVSFAVIMVFR